MALVVMPLTPFFFCPSRSQKLTDDLDDYWKAAPAAKKEDKAEPAAPAAAVAGEEAAAE